PETLRVLQLAMGAPLPESYGRTAYHGVHTFVSIPPDGERWAYRYHWQPEAGVATLSTGEALAPDYLATELRARLASGPVAFDLWWHFPDPTDDLLDPTTPWPDDRPSVRIGRLELSGIVADQDGGCEDVIFDPTRVVDGIECSDDPILHARSLAYGVSYNRRRAVGGPHHNG
ncbi:MAG: catalase, partial [Acidimicrobiales bacterium]